MILGNKSLLDNFNGPWQAHEYGEPMSMDRLMNLLGPNSIDVTLSKHIIVQNAFSRSYNGKGYHVDPMSREHNGSKTDEENCAAVGMVRHVIDEEGYTINPGEFILGCVQQRFNCNAHVANGYFVQMYEGRSTCGRLGLLSHVSAGFGDYGFQGAFTLEIVNLSHNIILLREGMRIGQVYFQQVSECISQYIGAYSHEGHYDKPFPPSLGSSRF